MTNACGNDEGQQPPSSTIQEDDFEFENGFHWKVVLLGTVLDSCSDWVWVILCSQVENQYG